MAVNEAGRGNMWPLLNSCQACDHICILHLHWFLLGAISSYRSFTRWEIEVYGPGWCHYTCKDPIFAKFMEGPFLVPYNIRLKGHGYGLCFPAHYHWSIISLSTISSLFYCLHVLIYLIFQSFYFQAAYIIYIIYMSVMSFEEVFDIKDGPCGFWLRQCWSIHF